MLLALFFSYSVIPTGVAGLFFRAVRGAPATEWRDRGNRSSNSKLDETSSPLFASWYFFAAICSLSSHTPGAFSSNSSATSFNTRAGTLTCTTSPSPLTASIRNFPSTIATRT